MLPLLPFDLARSIIELECQAVIDRVLSFTASTFFHWHFVVLLATQFQVGMWKLK